MNLAPLCESGTATKVLQEAFSLRFDIADLDIQESYEEKSVDCTDLIRKIKFPDASSSSQTIGQSINFPSAWCVIMKCEGSHAQVGLKFRRYYLKDGIPVGSNGQSYAIIKFRINVVDKDGDLLFEPKWKSWEQSRKIHLNKSYSRMDFMGLDELFDKRDFLMPNRTLRLLCEGVLYSNFVHTPVTLSKYAILENTQSPSLLATGEFCDVKLVAGGGESCEDHKAHKLILSDASPVLKNLLLTLSNDGNTEIPSLQLEDLNDSDISKMLKFIYSGNIKGQDWRNLEQVERLITLAKNYELRRLRWMCYNNLLGTMNLSSFTEIVRLFQKNSVEDNIRAGLYQFFLKNQDRLCQMKSFKTFAQEEKDAFLYAVLFKNKS